jgi:hypothetical protein
MKRLDLASRLLLHPSKVTRPLEGLEAAPGVGEGDDACPA